MKKGFTLIDFLFVLGISSLVVALLYSAFSGLTITNYEPYVMPQERMANEMKRANDLKELELQILRGKLQPEKNN